MRRGGAAATADGKAGGAVAKPVKEVRIQRNRPLCDVSLMSGSACNACNSGNGSMLLFDLTRLANMISRVQMHLLNACADQIVAKALACIRLMSTALHPKAHDATLLYILIALLDEMTCLPALRNGSLIEHVLLSILSRKIQGKRTGARIGPSALGCLLPLLLQRCALPASPLQS